jgi:hypothetical protein
VTTLVVLAGAAGPASESGEFTGAQKNPAMDIARKEFTP